MGLPWAWARIWAHKSSGAFSGGGGAFGGGGGGGDGGAVVGLWDDGMAGREGKEGVNERSHLGASTSMDLVEKEKIRTRESVFCTG